MKDAGKLRQASIGICVPSDSDRQYRTVVWCRFGGLVLSVRRPCTVGSTALYWQYSALVPEWQSCLCVGIWQGQTQRRAFRQWYFRRMAEFFFICRLYDSRYFFISLSRIALPADKAAVVHEHRHGWQW